MTYVMPYGQTLLRHASSSDVLERTMFTLTLTVQQCPRKKPTNIFEYWIFGLEKIAPKHDFELRVKF
jgi:hypothetical protein